ncbi:MAG: hypothetical protein GY757_23300 [bacterium]|nr:hypothetical protein [bacterium]
MSEYLKIAYNSISVFSDDGTMDMGELNFLMGLALADNVVDDDEKRVLGNVFKQVEERDVSSRVWDRIQQIKKKYSI